MSSGQAPPRLARLGVGSSGQPPGSVSVPSWHPPLPLTPCPLLPGRSWGHQCPLHLPPCPVLISATSTPPAPALSFPDLSLPDDSGPGELRGSQAARAHEPQHRAELCSAQGTRSSCTSSPPRAGSSSWEERASPGTTAPRCLQGIFLAGCPCRCLDRVPLVPRAGSCPLAGWQCQREGGRGRMSCAHPKCSQPVTLGLSTKGHVSPHSHGELPALLLGCPLLSQWGYNAATLGEALGFSSQFGWQSSGTCS